MRDMIDILNLDDKKLVPFNNLSSASATYWRLLYNHLKENDDKNYLEEVLPELVPFCNYILLYMKSKENRNLENWEQLEYEHILIQLLQILRLCDFADEVLHCFLNSYDILMT